MDREAKTPDGVTLHVSVEGAEDAPAVVLSHALGGTLRQWDALTAVLSERYRVIRYDSRGHGQSEAPAGPYSVAMLGGDALAVMDALRRAHVAFIGLSKGGMTGMWLAAHAPARIAALVLSNTTPFIPNKKMWNENIAEAEADGLSGIARPTLERWFGASFKGAAPATIDRHIAEMEAMPVAGYAGSCAVLRDVDLRDALGTIAAPTLVVAGEEDMPQAIQGARGMAAALPSGELVVIPAAGHLSPIENPAAFNAAVAAFLSRVFR